MGQLDNGFYFNVHTLKGQSSYAFRSVWKFRQCVCMCQHQCVCLCVCGILTMCIMLSSLLLGQRRPISAFSSVQLEEFSQHASEDDGISAGALVPVNSAQ